VDQAAHESSEAVGFSRGVLHAVATEPSDKENDGDFATDVFRAGDKGAQFVATAVAHPVVQNFGVGKVFTRRILLRAGAWRNGQNCAKTRNGDPEKHPVPPLRNRELALATTDGSGDGL